MTGATSLPLNWPRVAHPVTVFSVVTLLGLLRQGRFLDELIGVEPRVFWDPLPTMDPVTYATQVYAGYMQVWSRIAFLIAYPFGDAAPFATRLIAALVLGAVGAFVASDRMAPAIPGRWVRTAFAVSLGLLPVVAPYLGPLNSQWWVAIAVIVLAAVPARRYDMPLLVAAGFSGIAPCFALPLFRGWRFVALAIPTAIQGTLVLLTDPVPRQLHAEPGFFLVGVLLAAVSLVPSDLPRWTRVGFLFVGYAWMVPGSLRVTLGPDRYETAAWAGIALGLIASLAWIRERRRSARAADQPGRMRSAAQSSEAVEVRG